DIKGPDFGKIAGSLDGQLSKLDGLGFRITDLRAKNIPDERIYQSIIDSRDNFLRPRGWFGFNYLTILKKKQCLEVYGAVIDALNELQ
ncbi:unnamed protein product, partial [marine sediment metagenome]